MPYGDLREWIDALEKVGELKVIKKEVDWNLEVGAITRRVYDLRGPAPLFETIAGYPKGYRILGAPLGLSARNKYARLASVLDMPLDSDIRTLTEEYIRRKKKPIPPVVVKEGVCQQNVLCGDDVDLFTLPVPMLHEGDGGRYVGTWHSVITKDPDSDWVNYGMYRQMVFDRNHVGVPSENHIHLGQHYHKRVSRGERLEFATALGTEPVTAVVSATALGPGISEADIAGGLRGEPLELVKCKTVDLFVPATSEIVIEGFIDPEERRLEGPFGEYTGYNAGGIVKRAVCTVTAITHRDDPILPVSCMGMPVDDAGVVMNFSMGAELLEELRDIKKLPIDFAYFPPDGVGHFCVVSARAIPFKAFPRSLAVSAWGTKPGHGYAHVLMLVNDDIDITEVGQVIWAMATRVHPGRDIWICPNMFAGNLVPWLTPEEREALVGARVFIDASWPSDWPKEWIPDVSSFEKMWPKAIQESVLKNWKEYGFD